MSWATTGPFATFGLRTSLHEFLIRAFFSPIRSLQLCFNTAGDRSTLARMAVKFRFHGKAAHAAAAPEQGRSALDAVALTNHAAELMREHTPDQSRIHHVITAGGRAPNVTPDFAEFLLSVDEADRQGFVFNVELHRGICRRLDTVSKAIANIGKNAKVKVDQKGEKAVWASAHDLRRAFGSRWSRRVTSMVLKELMRHESVTTTETYYVNIDADATAAMLAGLVTPETETSSLGDTLGDTCENQGLESR